MSLDRHLAQSVQGSHGSDSGRQSSSSIDPVRPRRPRPILSSEHFRKARSSAATETGSLSSSFLTPPISTPHTGSPPPRAEADDYLSVHARRDDGKKHHGRPSRKRLNKRSDSPDLSPSDPSSRSRPELAKPGPPVVPGPVSEPILPARPSLDEHVPKPSSQVMPRLKSTPRIEAVAENVGVSENVNKDETSSSPAMESLRRLTQAFEENEKPQVLRRMSRVFSNSLKFVRANTFGPNSSRNVANTQKAPQRRTTNGQDPSLNTSLRESTLEDAGTSARGLGVPSSIILRKPSNVITPHPVFSSMNAYILNQNKYKAEPEAPSSELLAFYTSPAPRPTNKTSPTSSSKSELSYLDLTAKGSPSDEDALLRARKRSMSVSQIVQLPQIRRTSLPVEPIITFTDTHVAPGTFTVEPVVRPDSKASSDRTRRISVVEFRSGGSVHEIIWREDETTSGSSKSTTSRTSISPQQLSRTQTTKSANGKTVGSRTLRIVTPGTRTDHSLSPVHRKPSNGMRSWTWDNPSRPVHLTRKSSLNHSVKPGTSDPGHSHPGSPTGPVNTTIGSSGNSEQFFTSNEGPANFQAKEAVAAVSIPAALARDATLHWVSPSAYLNDTNDGRGLQIKEEVS